MSLWSWRFLNLEGGELEDHLKAECKLKDKLDEQYVASIMKQLLQALKYCHQQGVTHHDVKCQNIVFITKLHERIKLVDFGTAMQRAPTDEVEKLFGGKGDPFILAPEVYTERDGGKCYTS